MPAPTAAGVASDSGAQERVEFRVVDGEVEGGATRITVERGTPVNLVVTADRADEAHLHGYDRAVALQPGRRAEVRFTADVPGSFEFELHGSGALLARIEVR
ncbi:hypothetical protein XF36_16260 [Pseudonocardia sp. HH130629-09]|nr:hypothetical protein XF36_16260 [Pseudonocardia sp. HH130629-09]